MSDQGRAMSIESSMHREVQRLLNEKANDLDAMSKEERQQYDSATKYCRSSLCNWPPHSGETMLRDVLSGIGYRRDYTWGQLTSGGQRSIMASLAHADRKIEDKVKAWRCYNEKQGCIASGEHARGIAYARRTLMSTELEAEGVTHTVPCRGNAATCSINYRFSKLGQWCRVEKHITCDIVPTGQSKPRHCEIRDHSKQVVCCRHTLTGKSGTFEACSDTALQLRL